MDLKLLLSVAFVLVRRLVGKFSGFPTRFAAGVQRRALLIGVLGWGLALAAIVAWQTASDPIVVPEMVEVEKIVEVDRIRYAGDPEMFLFGVSTGCMLVAQAADTILSHYMPIPAAEDGNFFTSCLRYTDYLLYAYQGDLLRTILEYPTEDWVEYWDEKEPAVIEFGLSS